MLRAAVALTLLCAAGLMSAAQAGQQAGAAAGTQQARGQNPGPGNAADRMKQVDPAEAQRVLKEAKTTHPKFTAQLANARAHDPLLKDMHWVRGEGHGPAFASPQGFVTIDLDFLDTPKPGFNDDRMVVVLYHEIGHLHYFVTVPRADWTSDNSEQAAFEYSLKKTKELAEKGDCGPLKTGVYFMKKRSEGMNLQDPHVRALKRIVDEPMYAGYVQYVAETPACVAAPDPAKLVGR